MKTKAVHCETQEQWDYVTKTLGYTWNNGTWDRYQELTFINLEGVHYSNINNTNYDINLHTFKEWCNEFNHKPDFIKDIKESLVGRYVKVISNSTTEKYPLGTYLKISIDFDRVDCCRVEGSNRAVHRNEIEIMPEGFIPQKELTELPEFWCIKITDENATILGEFYGKHCYYGYKQLIPYDYMDRYLYSHNLYSKNSMFSKSPGSNYVSNTVLPDYTEISFEVFEKYVLNKESKSIKTEEPIKEVWIPKFKVGDKVRIPLSKQGNIWYKNNVSELDNYNENYFIISDISSNTNIGLSRDDDKNFRENSFHEDDLVPYVESTKEEWVPKIGDWVVVKSHSQAGEGNGIYKNNLISKLYTPGTEDASGMLLNESHFSVKHGNRFYNILKSHIIRKAEPHEIPIIESTPVGVKDVLNIWEEVPTFNSMKEDVMYNHIKQTYMMGIDPYDNEFKWAIIKYPKLPKECFKSNKLPTKSWY